METREKNILDAAKTVFSQYGMKRTTMNDIAEHADVSRQTLYNAFENKEAIYKAIIRAYTEETVMALNAHSDTSNSIDTGLDLIFHHLVFIPFDFAHDTPHGAELMEGIGNAAEEEIQALKHAFGIAISEMLRKHETALTKAGTSAKALGELIAHTTLALKHKAQGRKELEGLLASFKVLLLRTIS